MEKSDKNSDKQVTRKSRKSKIREQLFIECEAMADYALARGKRVPASAIETIELCEIQRDKANSESENINENDMEMIRNLTSAHSKLSEAVEPAEPQTILLLNNEKNKTGFRRLLGPTRLIRGMMLVAFVSLATFIGVVLSPFINNKGTNIFNSQGMPLLINLIFLISAAGLGGCFSALYKANKYIANLTYDENYAVSYWIRFLLGLMSGLILAVVISDKAIQNDLLEEGIIRPLLALLGGFSASLVYTFLNQMVESLKSLFEGSNEAMLASQSQEAKAKLTRKAVNNQMKLATDLLTVQKAIGTDSKPEEIQEQLNQLLEGLMDTSGTNTK